MASPRLMPDHEIENELPADGDTKVTSPPVANTPVVPTSPKTQKIPRALKRLLPHNTEGLAEGIINPEDGGRRRRPQRHDLNINMGGL